MDGYSKRGKFLKRAGLVILMGACAMLMSASQAGAVLIDHFESGDFILNLAYNAGGLPQSTGIQSQVGVAANLIQSNRSDELTIVGPAVIGFDVSNAKVDQTNAPSILTWQEGDSLFGTLTMIYHGSGAAFAPLVDLTDAGASTQFLFRYATDGLGHPIEVTIDVFSGASDHSTKTLLMPGTLGVAGATTAAIPFSSFSAVGTAADFTQATKVMFTFDSQFAQGGGGDYFFDTFETGTVPEPLTMLGMFLGLGGVGAYIRKRRMA
jgi:hypothetical protein